MPNKYWKTLTIYALLFVLASCGGSSNSGGPDSGDPTPPPSTTVEYIAVDAFPNLQFEQPLALLQAPGDHSRWYIVERRGRVLSFDNDANTSTTDTLIDLRNFVDSGPQEAGMLGMAFHPNFANNGEVFLSYTIDSGGLTSVITRYDTNTGFESPVLSISQDFGNHNGGHLAFGQDGFLYAGFGDGGSGDDPNNRAQDTTNLHGSIIRLDVDSDSPYAIPVDNPFAGNNECMQGFGSAPCAEIYAWGLRNPWRWSIDSTGTLWVGDVGQGRYEEINRVYIGENYGWRIREGAHCNIPASGCDSSGLTDPCYEYAHGDGNGRSVTGGYIYNGQLLDAGEQDGRYIFGDFISGKVWSLNTASLSTNPEMITELLDTGASISSFGIDQAGEIYFLDYSGGKIYRVEID